MYNRNCYYGLGDVSPIRVRRTLWVGLLGCTALGLGLGLQVQGAELKALIFFFGWGARGLGHFEALETKVESFGILRVWQGLGV